MGLDTVRRYVTVVVMLGVIGPSCVPRHRQPTDPAVARLEQELQDMKGRLEAFSLQTDSIAVGLEKQRERLEQMYPPTAQWLPLTPGATVRWYLGEDAGNLHVQCLEPPEPGRPVRVSVMTGDIATDWTPREGQSMEFSWEEGGAGQRRAVVVTFHRSLIRDDGRRFGLFSILAVKALDLP